MRRTGGIALPVLVLCACAWLTQARLAVWHSDLALWRDAAEKTPTRPRPVMDYGRALEMAGDLDGAERQYRQTISFALDDRRGRRANRFAIAAAETNIAHLYLRQGRINDALVVLTSTLGWWPDFPYAHYNIGRVLWEHGACQEGMQEILMARSQDTTLSLPSEPCATP